MHCACISIFSSKLLPAQPLTGNIRGRSWRKS